MVAGRAQHRVEKCWRSGVWMDPPSLVLEPNHYPAVADRNLACRAVYRPALLRPRIGQVEDRLEDRSVSRCLGNRVGDEIAGDPNLGSAARRDMGDDEGDQYQRPQHDDQRETAAVARRARERNRRRLRVAPWPRLTGEGWGR